MRFPPPLILALITIASVIVIYVITTLGLSDRLFSSRPQSSTNFEENLMGEDTSKLNPLTIESLRKGQYPGSDISIEQTLDPGVNYSRYIASYQSRRTSLSSKDDKSEGLKIYALLTVPNGEAPQSGWPVIIFNHGFIPPSEYKTTEKYLAYVDYLARAGYVVFKPDYRGHGNSEGVATGGYGSNAYTVDVLNAVSSIKKLNRNVILGSETTPESDSGQARMTSGPLVNPQKIGMWGHSMGGFITLKSMVVTKDIKAAVIWAGVVASYPDLLSQWRRGPFTPPPQLSGTSRRWRDALIKQYGTPEQNPQFWKSISSTSYLDDISGPVQLHHGAADQSVPVEFSQDLYTKLKDQGKVAELYTYPGNDHNISQSFNLAIQRSVEFFDKYLK